MVREEFGVMGFDLSIVGVESHSLQLHFCASIMQELDIFVYVDVDGNLRETPTGEHLAAIQTLHPSIWKIWKDYEYKSFFYYFCYDLERF